MQDPGPFLRGSHKGSYGTPEPRAAASAAARASRNLGGRGAPTAAGELAVISSGPGSSGTVTARF